MVWENREKNNPLSFFTEEAHTIVGVAGKLAMGSTI